MKKVVLTPATALTGVEFKLTDQEVDGFGSSRIAVKLDSVFDGKTLAFQVQDPSGTDWYGTGIAFSTVVDSPMIVRIRPNYNYRIVPSAIGGALSVGFMFF